MRAYFFLISALTLGVYSQNIMKWKVSEIGAIPEGFGAQLHFYVRLLTNTWILSAMLATFGAGLLWMATISIMDLSKAYPYVGLNFVLMFLSGVFFFNEPFSWIRFAGTIVVGVGVVMISWHVT